MASEAPEEVFSQISDLENKAPPNFAYLQTHLPQHAAATHAHLTGQIATTEGNLEHSFHPPAGYWTPAEKQLFFHGLAIYSRLRPDLIAAHIGTKTVVDVAIYIGLLQEGVKKTARSLLTSRADMPRAHEASEELVEFEEEQAALLCAAEPLYEAERRTFDREQAEIAFQSSLRAPRGTMKGVERDRAAEKEKFGIFERWKEEHGMKWGREDVLRSLDAVQLAVLDRILREGEDGRAVLKQDGEREESRRSSKAKAKDGPPPVDDALIDPALLAESSRAHTPHMDASRAPSSRPRTPPPAPPQPSNLPPARPGDEDGVIPQDLSPTSRRRLYKRLYMRRKRAEATGGVVSTEATRLKPGRRAKEEKKATDTDARGSEDLQLELQTAGAGPSNSADPSDEEDGGEVKKEDKKGKKKHNKGGTTRPYKIKRQLEDLKIDYENLREYGMDLFHLGVLGKLMRLYPQLDDTAPEGVTTHISGETIELLHALVDNFVRRLVHRTIEAREIEYDLKAQTKVWRLGKERQVLPRNVRVALELGGHEGLNKAAHFSALLKRFPEGSDDENNGEDGDSPPPNPPPKGKSKAARSDDEKPSESSSKPIDPNSLISHPHHIYLPFLHHPTVLPATYPFGIIAPGTQPALSVHERAIRSVEPELLSSEDEEELEEEIGEEERLDEVDGRVAGVVERAVWRDLGLGEKEEEGEVRKVKVLFARRGRKRKAREEEEEEGTREGEMQTETREVQVEESRLGEMQAEKEKEGGQEKKKRKKGKNKQNEEGRGDAAVEKDDTRERKDKPRKRRKVHDRPGPAAAREPDGVKIKSAKYVVDSDAE